MTDIHGCTTYDYFMKNNLGASDEYLKSLLQGKTEKLIIINFATKI